MSSVVVLVFCHSYSETERVDFRAVDVAMILHACSLAGVTDVELLECRYTRVLRRRCCRQRFLSSDFWVYPPFWCTSTLLATARFSLSAVPLTRTREDPLGRRRHDCLPSAEKQKNQPEWVHGVGVLSICLRLPSYTGVSGGCDSTRVLASALLSPSLSVVGAAGFLLFLMDVVYGHCPFGLSQLWLYRKTLLYTPEHAHALKKKSADVCTK